MPNTYLRGSGPDYGSVLSSTRRRRRRRRRGPNLPLLILALILLIFAVVFIIGRMRGDGPKPDKESSLAADASAESTAPEETEPETTVPALETLLAQADRLAMMYDYDAAIEMIQSDPEAAESEEGKAAVAKYEETKGTLVRQDISKITHVFFHTLIMDTSKAFDGDKRQDGYNDVMTTKDEFMKMMQSMYERGFVLVRLHDIAYEVDDTENGGKKMVAGDIMLPEGKKAVVISQDDVCYYEYMEGDGFASRIVIDENNKPRCEMIMDDGHVEVGAFDMVPLLDDFVDEHPDFSYRGSKGVVAVTGYNGVFGYRTDTAYEETNPNIAADREMVTKIAQCLRDDGWEIASHSWGHRNYGKISMSELQEDNGKWQDRVGSIVGGTDILIFPFGADVADWHPYKTDNERFMYLWRSGFRYFCNVDSAEFFVQKGNDFLRQGRRNLDGYRLWQDMTVKNRTSDLFNAEEIFDKSRPTPVPDYNGG